MYIITCHSIINLKSLDFTKPQLVDKDPYKYNVMTITYALVVAYIGCCYLLADMNSAGLSLSLSSSLMLCLVLLYILPFIEGVARFS